MMHDILQSKAMAKALRHALAERQIELSHSACLELVARQFGLPDWNGLAARIEALQPAPDLSLPEGWFTTGYTDALRYRLGLDPNAAGTVLIESRFERSDKAVPVHTRFACLMQSVTAGDYRGRKVRLTASLRTEDADTGTIWLRIDREPGSVLRFDNMMERKADGVLKGMTGWTERTIVLEVPEESSTIHYGFFLQGCGRVWAKSFRIEAVSADTATTDLPRQHGQPDKTYTLPKPSNLDFRRRASKRPANP